MAEGTGSDQPTVESDGEGLNDQSRQNINNLVAKVDAVMASPASRALKVWNALNKTDLTIWDLMCFTVEAQGFMATMFPPFGPLIKNLNLSVYSTHYFQADQIAQWEQPLPEKLP